MKSNHCIALSTCPNSEVANNLARRVIKQQLAACVNIIPNIQSVYRWNGKIENDNESLLIIKTTQSKLVELEYFIQEHHPYDTPEFIVVNIESGSQNYLNWITQAVKEQST